MVESFMQQQPVRHDQPVQQERTGRITTSIIWEADADDLRAAIQTLDASAGDLMMVTERAADAAIRRGGDEIDGILSQIHALRAEMVDG